MSHDALHALYFLVDQLDYFTRHKTTPDLDVIVGNKERFEKLLVNRLLQLKEVEIKAFYDTTFILGDVYVSTLTIRHPMFKKDQLYQLVLCYTKESFSLKET